MSCLTEDVELSAGSIEILRDKTQKGLNPLPIALTLNLQMLFPVDDFWGVQELLTILEVFREDLVSIGVVIKVICHVLLAWRKDR